MKKKKILMILLMVMFIGLTGCGKKMKRIETDAEPTVLAMDARGSYLYIACEGGKKIIVWDIKKKKRHAQIECDTGPLKINLTNDNQRLVVLSKGAHRQRIYSVPELKELNYLELPDGPTAWVKSNNTKLDYFACPDSNVVRTYLGKTPLPIIEAGLAPVALLQEHETGRIWVANYKAHELGVVNLENNSVVKRVPVWPNPTQMLMGPFGDKLYVLCKGIEAAPAKSVVQLIDLNYQTAGLKWQVGEDIRAMTFGPKMRFLFLIGPGIVKIYTADSGVEIDSFKTGKNPQSIVVSPDGKKVYVACRDEHAVFAHKIKREALMAK